jgi:hypothetical protein
MILDEVAADRKAVLNQRIFCKMDLVFVRPIKAYSAC